MTKFKRNTRSYGNFLYEKKQSVFTVLYRLTEGGNQNA